MINSMFFEFGNNPGQVAITGSITDSIFRNGYGIVSGLAYSNQDYSMNFTQGDGWVDYSNIFSPQAGDKVRVDFINPMIIQKA